MTKKVLISLLSDLQQKGQAITVIYAVGNQEPSLIRRDHGSIENIIRQRQSCLNEHLQLKLAENHWSWIKISHIKEIEVDGENIFHYPKTKREV